MSSGFNVSAADLRLYNWQAVIAAQPTKICHSYFGPLWATGERLGQAGDDRGKRVYGFLAHLVSFDPNYGSAGNPYDRIRTDNAGMSSVEKFLLPEELDVLAEIFDEITDPEFKARAGDILWECKRDYKAARATASPLLASAQRLESKTEWPLLTQRLDRAIQLAAAINARQDLFPQVVQSFEDYIQKYKDDSEAGLLCDHLIATLLRFKTGNVQLHAQILEAAARRFEGLGNWDFAIRYWKSAALHHLKRQDAVAEKAARLAAAEGIVQKAEANLVTGKLGYGFSAHWMAVAFQELRQAGATQTRIDQIHQRTLDLQKESLTEFDPLELPDDVATNVATSIEAQSKRAKALVSGSTLEDALFKLAYATQPIDPKAIRIELENNAQHSIAHQIMGSAAVTGTGQVSATIGPLPSTSGPEREAWFTAQSYMTAKQVRWPLMVDMFVDPAREQIIAEHDVDILALVELCTNNPAIPQGHEIIFARALHAGFYGDWLVSMHLLIPQIEAMIRHVFKAANAITTTMDSEGNQKELDLGGLLYLPSMEVLFKPEMTFSLRGILVEKFGCNLRNEMSHGLPPIGAFYSPEAVYLWWLAVHLAVFGKGSIPEIALTP